MTQAKLRHIALSVDDPFATAAFYKEAFGMTEVGQTNSPLARGVYLSDGTICLAILSFKEDRWAGKDGKAYRGIHHMGFWVDSVDGADRAVKDAGGSHFAGRPKPSEGDVSNTLYEEKYLDPNGVMVDVTAHGWPGAKKD
jgi:methylmalonyl-CoA/ethylmalonyl-CoA epimerase